MIVVLFAATASGQSPRPLYRTAGRTVGTSLVASAKAGTGAGRVTRLERASLSSLAALRAGMAVNLPLTDAESVDGTVNLVQTENGWTRSGGILAGGTPGTFSLNTNGSEVAGFILRPGLRQAYRFETLPGGDVVLREVALNDVVCGFLPPMVGGPPAPRAHTAGEAVAPPILNNRPEATAQLYLDFDGETVTDPAWNGGRTIVAAPADVSASEINDIFVRVQEDFLPFNVNVTTDVNRYNNALPGKRMRCIITPTDTAAPGAGGVAILYSFANAGKGLSTTVPCWVFNGGVVGIAEAISHELGHTFGLHHDGREINGQHEEYFIPEDSGPTGWGPIMGAAYYVTVSQWSKGEYQYANNQEDDLAIVGNSSNGFGLATDEAGGTIPTATRLGGDASGPNQAGVITQAGDVDFWSFTTTGGAVTLRASLAAVPDLDVALELLGPSGNTLGTARPAASLPATLNATVPQGTYYLKVSGDGEGNPFLGGYSNYASLGAYTITGAVPGFGAGLLPNLTFAKPTGFSDKLVVATTTGSTTDAPVFYAADGIYLDFAVTNNGFAPAGAFPTAVYVDNVLRGTVASTANPLPNGTTVPTLDYSLGPLPEGTHVIRVQADPANAVTETDETDNAYSRTITVIVPGPPVITSGTSAGGNVGAPFTYAIKATNLPTSYAAQGLPPGLGLKAGTGFITGTPTVAGTYNALLTVANGLGSATATLTITILPAPPVVVAPGGLTGEVGAAFSYGIAASNGPSGYMATGLPPGLSVDQASGLVTGTPTTTGNYPVALGAFNAGGTAAPVTVNLEIREALVITSAGTAAGRVGLPFSFRVTASNVPIAYTATGLPDGLGIDAGTGLISGTPNVAGNFTVTVSVSNGIHTISTSLSLTVAAPLTVAAWGSAGQAAVPVDLPADVVAVTAGTLHSLALLGDGTVVAWGANDLGQLNVPAGLRDVVAISAGSYHNLALRRDGTVAAWGNNAQGQTDVPAGLANVVGVAAGAAHSLALKADGTVVAWGDDTFGQAAPPANLQDVVGIAAGVTHSLALHANGTATGWGSNGSGQLSIPGALTGLKQVAAGDGFSVLLRTTGGLVITGTNNAGQLNFPAGLADVVSVATGGKHILALRGDGTVAAWGSNAQGESLPPTTLRNVAALAAGGVHGVALMQAGPPRTVAVMPATPSAGTSTLLAYGVGAGPVACQWSRDNVDLSGQTASFLRLADLPAGESGGVYTFRLSNASGSAVSPGLTLSPTRELTTVSVAVTTAKVTAGSGGSGVLTITREGDLSKDLTVNYSVKGTAGNGTDYVRLKGFKKLQAGKASAKIKVVPTRSLGGAAKKVVKFTLLPGDGYTVGTPDPVKIKILAMTP